MPPGASEAEIKKAKLKRVQQLQVKYPGLDETDYALLDEDETFLTPAQRKKKKLLKMKLKKTIDI